MRTSKSLNSINTLSKRRVNTFILLGCFLFSGITWLGLPITLIGSNNQTADIVVYFFSVVNALQGIFIFTHFIFTTRLLLKRSKSKETPSGSRTQSADIEKNDISKINSTTSHIKSIKTVEQLNSFYDNNKDFIFNEKINSYESASEKGEDSDSDYN
jgi:hypothetical protein